jgi:transcription initiation factor TFIID subunit TAF12
LVSRQASIAFRRDSAASALKSLQQQQQQQQQQRKQQWQQQQKQHGAAMSAHNLQCRWLCASGCLCIQSHCWQGCCRVLRITPHLIIAL